MSRRRRIGITALAAAGMLLAALLIAGDRSSRSEARPFEIDLTKVHVLDPDYRGIFRDSLALPREPYTPQNLPSTWRDHEQGSWRYGYRTCRKPWHDVVAAAGLTGLVPASPPESVDELTSLAWKLLYANSEGLELSEINTNRFDYTVQGCVDGVMSFSRPGGTRGGIDAAP